MNFEKLNNQHEGFIKGAESMTHKKEPIKDSNALKVAF